MKRILSVLLLLLFATAGFSQDGLLDSARKEVRTPAPASSSPSAPKECKGGTDLDFSSDDLFGEDAVFSALGKLGMQLFIAPVSMPIAVLEDEYIFSSRFVQYPYARGWKGSMQISPLTNELEGKVPATWERMFSFRTSIEAGSNFNGLNRFGGTFLIDSMTRFGIGGSLHYYEEKKDRFSPDQLWLGDVELLYRFAQSEDTQFRVGVGTRFLHDNLKTDWGINFIYGFEVFPKRPWTIGGQLELGTLGEASVIRATGKVGRNWKHGEFYMGYDFLRIGKVRLDGPMLGLRVWF